jgi:hypothetical protein
MQRKLTVALAVLAGLMAGAAPAMADRYIGTGTKKWAVVLCNFSDQPNAPRSMGYWERFFSDAGAGKVGMFDYWKDVSFGQLSISGTTVVGWNNARDPADPSKTLTRGQWQALGRKEKIIACANGPEGFDFSSYWGVVAIFPEAISRTTAAISETDTTVTLAGREHFPSGTAPFLMGIGNEIVRVTGRTENTFTIERGQGGSKATSHPAGSTVGVHGDLGGWSTGQLDNIPIRGKRYSIATIVLPHHTNPAVTAHEMGHGSGYDHSRGLSSSADDYGDFYDVMGNFYGVTFSADPRAGNYQPNSGENFGIVDEPDYFGSAWFGNGSKGPGLVAINLDLQGWIPGPRHLSFDNSAPRQTTATLHSLSDPTALSAPADHYLEARVPAARTIQNQAKDNGPPTIPPSCEAPAGCTTSDYYTVEYRQKSGWDRGIQRSGVLLHLKGKDERAYWLDRSPAGEPVPGGGLLGPGDEYVDADQKTYVAVNSVDGPEETARVTIASDKVGADLTWSGDTSGDFSDAVKLAADLKVSSGGAPMPRGEVKLSIGEDACSNVTDGSGHAECHLGLTQQPGAYTATATFAGTAVYKAAEASASFTINKETTSIGYTGAATSDYHDAFTATAKLVDTDGRRPQLADRPVRFELGTGDECTATTDRFGVATCEITPTQVPGSSTIVASFAGDDYYQGSRDSKPFTISKQQTHLTYDGPTQVANDFPATLKGTLTEEEAGGTPIDGRTVTFTLGAGATAQSCEGTSDAAGKAQCTIAKVNQPGSTTTLSARAAFAGDTYYLTSEDSVTIKLLFYTGRAFGASAEVLGLPLIPPQADTGSIQTSARSQTERHAVFGALPLVTTTGLSGSVTTGLGTSTGRATAATVSIGLPGLPVIRAEGIVARSESTCQRAAGSATIGSLTIGGARVEVGAEPSTIRVGTATLKLNEQTPVAGADHGLTVNALHLDAPGLADVVVASARSDIHNCG